MAEMICRTKLHETSLTVVPLNDKIMGLKIRRDGVTEAEFGLAEVWDFILDALRDIEIGSPEQWLGLERRCFEAKYIRVLTYIWEEEKKKQIAWLEKLEAK